MTEYAELIMTVDKEMEGLIRDHFDLSKEMDECSREVRVAQGTTTFRLQLPDNSHSHFLFAPISKMIIQQFNEKNKP